MRGVGEQWGKGIKSVYSRNRKAGLRFYVLLGSSGWLPILYWWSSSALHCFGYLMGVDWGWVLDQPDFAWQNTPQFFAREGPWKGRIFGVWRRFLKYPQKANLLGSMGFYVSWIGANPIWIDKSFHLKGANTKTRFIAKPNHLLTSIKLQIVHKAARYLTPVFMSQKG